MKNTYILRSHRSKVASLWTLKNSNSPCRARVTTRGVVPSLAIGAGAGGGPVYGRAANSVWSGLTWCGRRPTRSGLL